MSLTFPGANDRGIAFREERACLGEVEDVEHHMLASHCIGHAEIKPEHTHTHTQGKRAEEQTQGIAQEAECAAAGGTDTRQQITINKAKQT